VQRYFLSKENDAGMDEAEKEQEIQDLELRQKRRINR